MSRFHIATTIPNRWEYVVNTTQYITGYYPNINYRVEYNFQWYSKANGANFTVDNMDYKFNDYTQRKATYVAVNAGQYSGTFCSRTVDLGWNTNARSQSHSVDTEVTSSYIKGSGRVGLPTLTIPAGTLSAGLIETTHNKVTFNISFTNPYNFWVVKVYDSAGKLYKDKCPNGSNTVEGLSPGKNYVFNIKLVGRDGSVVVNREVRVKTTGFSYINPKSVYIAEPLSLVLKTYNDNFTNTIRLVINKKEYYYARDIKSKNLEYVFTIGFSAAKLDALYDEVINTSSIVGTIEVDTYENNSLLGSTQTNITFIVNPTENKPIISNIGYVDVSSAVDKTENAQWIVEGVSVVRINCIVTTKNQATIKKYIVEIDGNIYENTDSTIVTDKPIRSHTGIYVTVVDSRGFQSTKLKTYDKFIGYTPPFINEIVAIRRNDVEETTNLKLKGVFNRLTINGIAKNIDIALKYRYKKTTSSNWNQYLTKIITIQDNEFFYDNIIGSFDTGETYDIEVVVSDYFSTAVSQTTLIKGTFELFIGDGYVEVNGGFFYNDRKLMDIMYPIGMIVEFDRNVNPNIAIGGTWERFGDGRVTVGMDTAQTEFQTINKVGGAKTHTLTINEIPSHTHLMKYGSANITSGSIATTPVTATYNTTGTTPTNEVGGGVAHNNLQPYIVVIRWVRIA